MSSSNGNNFDGTDNSGNNVKDNSTNNKKHTSTKKNTYTCYKCGTQYTLTSSQINEDKYGTYVKYCTECISKMKESSRTREWHESSMSSDEETNETTTKETRVNRRYNKPKRPYANTLHDDDDSTGSIVTNNNSSQNTIDGSQLLRLLMLFDNNRTGSVGIQPALPGLIASSATGSSSPGKPDLSTAPFEWIGDDIKNIDDLIRLGKEYDRNKHIKTNLDMYQLSKLVKPLEELQDMIGMESVKESIFHMATYHLQGLETPGQMTAPYHTSIMGDSGLGKTELAGIICKLYHGIGLLKNPDPIIADKNNFEGKFLGHTADKVNTLVQKARKEGRALLTDEAYMILDKEGRDSFAQNSFDIMVKEMGKKDNEGNDNGGGFIWITMGYEKAMQEKFFGANQGLDRRFPYKLIIEEPDGSGLAAIFLRACRKQKWKCSVSKDVLDKLFTAHRDYMPHHGGSVINLITHCKHAHSRRLLSIKAYEELQASKKVINLDDIKAGIEAFGKNVAANFLRCITRQDWECKVSETELNKLFGEKFNDPTNDIISASENIESNDLDTNVSTSSVKPASPTPHYMHSSDHIHIFIEHCKHNHVNRLQKLNALEALDAVKKTLNIDDINASIDSYIKANGNKPSDNIAVKFIRTLVRQNWACDINESELNELFVSEFDDQSTDNNTSDTDTVSDLDMDTYNDVYNKPTPVYMYSDDHINNFIQYCKIEHAERIQLLNPLEILETTKKSINTEDVKSAIAKYKAANGVTPSIDDDSHVNKFPGLYT